MTAREEFAAALAEEKRLRAAPFERAKEAQEQLNELVAAAARQQIKPKAKRPKRFASDSAWFYSIVGDEAVAALRAPFVAECDALYDTSKIEEKKATRETQEKKATRETLRLADAAEIRHSDEWRCYSSRSAYDYSTQTAPLSYAKARCEVDAATVRAADPSVEVCVVYCPGDARAYEASGYLVAVKVAEDLDCEILRRRVPLDLKETVRAALKAGANPWVLHPFLDPNFMTRNKLGWQGQDLP